MATITPILDTLLSSVSGRAGDTARAGEKIAERAVAAVRGGRESGLSLDESRARQHASATTTHRSAKVAGAEATQRTTGNAGPETKAASSGRDPGLRAASIRLHLSQGAQTLARLLADIEPGKTRPVTTHRPLLTSAGPPNVARLAETLARQLSGSGLFYESHLAAWVRGHWPRARLLREPQAMTRAMAQATIQASESGATTPAASTAANGAAPGSSVADSSLASIVAQQAELLASGVFSWTGYAWQGVPMRWSVERRASDGHAEQSAGSPCAQTSIALDLPGIGPFEARLTLTGDSLDVATWVTAGPGRRRLDEGLPDLAQRLHRAGFSHAATRLVADTEPA